MIKRRGEDIYEETIIRHTVQPRADAADDAGTYVVKSADTVWLKTVAKSKKSFTVPASIKIGGKTFRVTGMNDSAFRGTKVKKVKVRVGKKSDNRKYIKKYRKIFTKKNAGRKVSVK